MIFRYPLDIDIKIKIVKYWLRIISLPDDDILKMSYLNSAELDASGVVSWATSVRLILANNGMYNTWLKQTSPDNINSVHVLNTLKTRLKDQYFQIAHDQMWNDENKNGTGNKLRFYRNFKQTYEREIYLSEVKIFKQRQAFSRLRVSNHVLRIETGRYSKEPVNTRKCIFCNQDSIEDECHMLLYCSLYLDIRKSFFTEMRHIYPYFSKLPEIEKLNRLMNPEKSVSQLVTKFVYSCLQTRHLYINMASV